MVSNSKCGEHEQDETVGDAAREEVDYVVVNAIILILNAIITVLYNR